MITLDIIPTNSSTSGGVVSSIIALGANFNSSFSTTTTSSIEEDGYGFLAGDDAESNKNSSQHDTWSSSTNDDLPSFAPTTAAAYVAEVGMEDEEGEEVDLYLNVPMMAAVTSKVMASLSFIGSYIILREIYKDTKDSSNNIKSNMVISNLLISLSVADIMSSVCIILGTLMSPAYLSEQGNIWGAKGTVVTCEIQGFFVVWGYMASPLFNCALAATYLLLIRYHKRDPQLQPYQPYWHGTIWLFCLVLAIIPLPFDWYNNGGDICWSAASPFYCIDYNAPCERGSLMATIYGATLYIMIPTLSVIFCGIAMCLIWSSVRNMEDRASVYTSGWSTDGDDDDDDDDDDETTGGQSLPPPQPRIDRTKSQEMMRQGIFFILAFFVTYFPAIFTWLLFDTAIFDVLLFVSYSVLLPLQGFWNCLVFIRQRQMKTWEGRIFRYSFFLWRDDSSEARRRRSGQQRRSA